MNVDIANIRLLATEKGIGVESLIETLEAALLTAYRHTEGHAPHARVEVDRTSGSITVLGQEVDETGAVVREWDDTPHDFGRIAAGTARQVFTQRFRDADNERVFGDFAGREQDLITGTVSADAKVNARGIVVVSLGDVEGVIPAAEQVPGETYQHGQRLRCFVVSVSRGLRGPQITLSRTHPNLVRKLFALEVPEIADGTVEITAVAREAGHRSKIAVKADRIRRQRQGRVHRSDGQPGPGRDERAERREDRHHRPLRRSGHVRRQRPVPGQGPLGRGRRPGGQGGQGGGSRFPALTGDRQGGSERPTRRPAHRLAHRHPIRRGRPTGDRPVDADPAAGAHRCAAKR